MTGLRVVEASRSEWDALVCQFSDRTVFHCLGWLEALERAHRVTLLLLKASANGRCVGIWPLLTLRKGPLRIIGSPLPGWATVYLGPLFADHVELEAVVNAFMSMPVLRMASFCYVKVIDSQHAIDLTRYGFTRGHRFRTYVLDIQRAEEELWWNLEVRCRNMLRKARKCGVTVEQESGKCFVDEYWRMSEEVFAHSHMHPNYSYRLLVGICAELPKRDEAFMLAAYRDGKRIAAVVLPHDDQTVYYWGGASRFEGRRYAPNNLLLWEAIRLARRRSLKRFDFVSIYGGPGKFKRSYGPQEVPVATHWERARTPVIGTAKYLYESWIRRQLRVRTDGSTSDVRQVAVH